MSYSRTELEGLKAAELRPIAKALGVTGASKRKKEENIVRIIDAQNEQTAELDTARTQPQVNEPIPAIEQAEDRIVRPATANHLPVDIDTASRVAKGGQSSVAIYLFALRRLHGRRREARKFRKLVRAAGFVFEASVDLRNYHESGELKAAA